MTKSGAPAEPSEHERETRADQSFIPQDSVLRRIDDDVQLAERRAQRRMLLGDALGRALEVGEEAAEHAEHQHAKASGRTRSRRQTTTPLFRIHSRLSLGRPQPETVVAVLLAVALMALMIWAKTAL